MPKENLEKYVSVLERILAKCDAEYSDIFTDKPLFFYDTVADQDEETMIGIKKKDEKFSYYFGCEFSDYFPPLSTSLESVAEQFQKLKVSPENIVKYFKYSIGTLLGKYLAEKQLADLEDELLT